MNRTLLAIAAYNAGPAKITKCRKLAEEMGYDPNKWFGNVEVATAKLVGKLHFAIATSTLPNHLFGS